MKDEHGWSVLAVDPGQTTGWAWACIGRGELERKGLKGALEAAVRHSSGLLLGDKRFDSGQMMVGSWAEDYAEAEAIARLSSFAEVLHEQTARVSNGKVSGLTDVVIEDFLLRERTMDRNLLSPVRVTTGLVQELFQHYPLADRPRLHYYQPSDSKSTSSDQRLKQWDIYVKGGHARDAVRLLILFFRKLGVN